MTGQIKDTRGAIPNWHIAAFWAAILAGAAVRLVALGRVPGGLNSDEASSGVEALSILRTGMDLWGNHMPVWFPAWGSGMNALYTYLAVPVIWLFGLNVVSLRAVGAIFGVLTLPVAYHATRVYFGRGAALITLLLVALLPWHVMSSRWALDSNLAPFFFTLGLYTIGKALDAGGRWPVLAFIPWAIAIYAYPVVLCPIVPSSLAILFLFRRRIVADSLHWVVGIAIAFLIALPFLLFVLKNYLLHGTCLPFESVLPFSVPELATSRLNQIGRSFPITIFNNLIFLVGGYRGDAIWHQSRFFPPLTGAAPYLTAAGAMTLGWRWYKEKRPDIVLIVAATIIIPICVVPLQLTRLNWFYIPSLMMVAQFLIGLPAPHRGRLLVVSGLYLGLFLVPFYAYYFTRYNQEVAALDENLGNGFRLGIEDFLRAEVASAEPDEPIFVGIGMPQPYLYPLFYGLADTESFRATRQMEVVDGVYRVSRFGRFVFVEDALPKRQSFVFVSRSNNLPCLEPAIIKSGPLWVAGRCPADPS